ncbi:uncharacterized protein EV420DRAFT_1709804 [Desarmillaria tabescens]|uniref:Uncharacterized protein n=1 Tax=Armillaria tabescens TaxID=1929756 RepID=A0AA39TTM0_ARMTA|nr:uncharacterized protein EV420DRAFT_1709804 [Desarmillaria tabescens]KAK0466063.1 hypothetical protein EV420DRAFT_1709804 [Desarmillaria tabescens]
MSDEDVANDGLCSPVGQALVRQLIRPRLPHDIHDYVLEGICKALDGTHLISVVKTGGKTTYFSGYMIALQELQKQAESSPVKHRMRCLTCLSRFRQAFIIGNSHVTILAVFTIVELSGIVRGEGEDEAAPISVNCSYESSYISERLYPSEGGVSCATLIYSGIIGITIGVAHETSKGTKLRLITDPPPSDGVTHR